MRNKALVYILTYIIFLTYFIFLSNTLCFGHIRVFANDNFIPGSGSEDDPYIIDSLGDICRFADNVKNGNQYEGKYISITKDIYLNNISKYDQWNDVYQPENIWEPIPEFKGILDGNGNTIYGLYVNLESDSAGLFSSLADGAEIKNLNIDKSFVKNSTNTALLVGSLGGGRVDTVRISNVSVSGNVIGGDAGGILGTMGSGKTVYIDNCENNANINATGCTGGIIGFSRTGEVSINKCINRGEIKGSSYCGGICGYVWTKENAEGITILEDLVNFGTIDGGNYIGGIIGELYTRDFKTAVVAKRLANHGTVKGGTYIGGCIGSVVSQFDKGITIENSYNDASVTGSGDVGGVVGIAMMKSCGYISVTHCFNSGMISSPGKALVGNFSSQGWDDPKGNVGYCYFLDTGSEYASGSYNIVGDVFAYSSIQMMQESSFLDFDFDNVWKMGETHPVLRWERTQNNNKIEILPLYPANNSERFFTEEEYPGLQFKFCFDTDMIVKKTFDDDSSAIDGVTAFLWRYDNDIEPIAQTNRVHSIGVNTWSVDFLHSTNLEYNTKYFITIDKDAFDFQNPNYYAEITNKDDWCFTTIPDTHFKKGVNNNCFLHSPDGEEFKDVNGYPMGNSYFIDLLKYLAPGEMLGFLKIMIIRWAKWNGSCYGIATTQGLLSSSVLQPNDISSKNQPDYYHMKPSDDDFFRHTVNYYHFTQFPNSIVEKVRFAETRFDVLSPFSKTDFKTTLDRILDELNKGNPVILRYAKHNGPFSLYEHAVLALTYIYDSSKDEYDILYWDCNFIHDYCHFKIKKDFSDYSFKEMGKDELCLIRADSVKKMIRFGDKENVSISNINQNFIIEDATEIRITDTQTGRFFNYDGTSVSGDLEIVDIKDISGVSVDSDVMVITVNGSGCYNVYSNNNSINVNLYDNDNYVSVTVDGTNEVNISLLDGATIKGDNYSFSAFINTDEMVSESQKGLLSFSGNATSDVTISRMGNKAQISSDREITDFEANSYNLLDKKEVQSDTSVTNFSALASSPFTQNPENNKTVYSIATVSGTGGTISPSGNTSIEKGKDQNYVIMADAGYKVKDVKVDNVSIGAVERYTFSNVTADHTIEAIFEKISEAVEPGILDPQNLITKYTIVSSAEVGGSITPSGVADVKDGESKTYAIEAEDGYKIKDVKVDNVSIGVVSTYTFRDISGNHTIIAFFEEIKNDNKNNPEDNTNPENEENLTDNGTSGNNGNTETPSSDTGLQPIETHHKGTVDVGSILIPYYTNLHPDTVVKKMKFKSSNKKIVKVNKKGIAKGGKQSGSATITMYVKTVETITKPNGKQKKKVSKWTSACVLDVNNTGKQGK